MPLKLLAIIIHIEIIIFIRNKNKSLVCISFFINKAAKVLATAQHPELMSLENKDQGYLIRRSHILFVRSRIRLID